MPASHFSPALFLCGSNIWTYSLSEVVSSYLCWPVESVKKCFSRGKKACHHSVLGSSYWLSMVGKSQRITFVLPSLVWEQSFRVCILISLLACWKCFSLGRKASTHCVSGDVIGCPWEVNAINHFSFVLCCVGAILGCITYQRSYPHLAACLQKWWKGLFPGKESMEPQCLNCKL